MTTDRKRLTCHCGAVELSVVLSQDLQSARRCNCSFCRRRGAEVGSAAFPDGLKIVKGAENLTLYQWGTSTAEHYFCKICGIYTHHKTRSEPTVYGINIAALDGVDPSKMDPFDWADGNNHPSDRK